MFKYASYSWHGFLCQKYFMLILFLKYINEWMEYKTILNNMKFSKFDINDGSFQLNSDVNQIFIL